MIIQCHPYNSCHVQQPFLEHSQGFIQFQCPSLFADDFIISLHELDISFDIFPRSKMMLTPLKINQQNLQKKNSEPIHLHFWGGSTKMKTFQGCSPPQNQQKKNNKLEDLTHPGSAPATNPNVQQHHKPTWPVRPSWDFFAAKGRWRNSC